MCVFARMFSFPMIAKVNCLLNILPHHIAAPSVWNALPFELRSCNSLSSFKLINYSFLNLSVMFWCIPPSLQSEFQNIKNDLLVHVGVASVKNNNNNNNKITKLSVKLSACSV